MGCRWAHLSSFGTMRRRWVVTGSYSSSLGPLVIIGPSSSSLVTWPVLVVVGGPIRRRCWIVVRACKSAEQGSERNIVELIVVGMSPGPTSGLVVVGSLGPCSSMLASFAWPWLGWAAIFHPAFTLHPEECI